MTRHSGGETAQQRLRRELGRSGRARLKEERARQRRQERAQERLAADCAMLDADKGARTE